MTRAGSRGGHELQEPASYWVATSARTSYPTIERETKVDVAIVGGGIVGISTAVLLKQTGATVAVIEARRVAEGISGHTTAKVTSLHTLIYDHLLGTFGEEKARMYGEANQEAIATIRRLCAERSLDCDLAEANAYTFAESDSEVEQIQKEVEAAQRLGLPAAYYEDVPLPFPVKAAVGFSGQAHFHPRKYLLPLSAVVPGDGSFVFEGTRVVEVEDGRPHRMLTSRGHAVVADHVIVATSLPVVDKGLFFARAEPQRGYAVAMDAGPEGAPPGMFINSSSPTHSVRPAVQDGRTLLILAGEGHHVGEGGEHAPHWLRLEEWGRSALGAGETRYRWSTQDYYSIDKAPFIGRQPGSDDLYVATGFSAWGMTGGTVAAMILADLVRGVENPWAEAFDPARTKVRSLPAFVKKGVHDAKRLIGDRLPGGAPATERVAEIPRGGGAIVELDGEHVAAHRDDDGNLHAVSATCTHTGCIVRWNDAERSWDCPCHGSRFSVDGAVVQAPAKSDLKRHELAIDPAGRTQTGSSEG